MAQHTILLVDDEGDLLVGLRVYLEANKFNVLYAADGDDAMRIIVEQNVDLLIMDVGMTDVRGTTMIDRLAGIPVEEQPPAVILSSHDISPDDTETVDRIAGIHGLIDAISDCFAVPC